MCQSTDRPFPFDFPQGERAGKWVPAFADTRKGAAGMSDVGCGETIAVIAAQAAIQDGALSTSRQSIVRAQ